MRMRLALDDKPGREGEEGRAGEAREIAPGVFRRHPYLARLHAAVDPVGCQHRAVARHAAGRTAEPTPWFRPAGSPRRPRSHAGEHADGFRDADGRDTIRERVCQYV